MSATAGLRRMRALTLKHSVGAKIFGAFLLMGLLIGVLGVYGYGKLRASGRIVAQIYDGPLMATSYARAANVDFELMRNTMLGLSAAPPQARAKIEHEMDEQADALFADLNVADERGMEADEHAIIRDLRTLVHQWTEMRHASADDPRIAALEDEIGAKFDMLIELNADHGFIARRKSISAVSYYEYA